MRPPSTAFASLAITVALALMAAAPAGATIYYRGSTTLETVNGASSVALSAPTGTTAGDLLVADVDAAGTTAITPPASGWTSIFTGPGFATYSTVHYRVATAADAAGASYTWNLRSSRNAGGGMMRYAGVDASSVRTPPTHGANSG